MAHYSVRLATVPGRLAVSVPVGRGVIEGSCVVCHGAMPDKETGAEDDGLVSHGVHSECMAEYRRRYMGKGGR